MRSKLILALVLLNAVLLVTLLFPHTFTRTVKAAPAGPRASEYLMVSGEVQGGNGGLVFIVDTRNNLLTAFAMNGQKLDAMPPLDLSRVFK